MRLLLTAQGCALLLMSVAAPLFNSSIFAIDPSEATQTIAHSSAVQQGEKADYDLAKLEAQARVVYVSSGAIALTGRMIDNDVRTGFRFSGSDLHPTLIVELAQSKSLHRVSAVFNAEGNAKLDIYLLSEPPKTAGDLTNATPLACVVDRTNAVTAEAVAEFAPNTARYVAFRWTREKSSRTPFIVTEIGAFSSAPATQFPPMIAAGELHLAGEKGTDFSNNLGTLAEPPGIAVVSP
jgi:hypothetical protein